MIRLLRRAVATTAVAAITGLFLIAPPLSPASAETINSTGPLEQILVSPDLNCQVKHVDDDSFEWFGAVGCGTFLAVNDVLYGPLNVSAGGNAGPRTAWTPVSQTVTAGSGTAASPYTVVTVVAAGTTGVTLTQTDTYILGQELYNTSVVVSNGSTDAQVGNIYTAGDCYLQDSDSGYGRIVDGAPTCTATQDADSRVEQLLPRTPGSSYIQSYYGSVWSAIGTRQPLPNTCICTSNIDNGIGLSWPVSIAPAGTASYAWSTVFSPTGALPLSTSATADVPTVTAGDADGYTITVVNTANLLPVTLDSLVVTLPAGFTYTAGSTTGLTTADGTQVGQTLTFTGPIVVPSAASGTIHFGVTTGPTAGTFTIDVDATSATHTVDGVTATAPITVEEAPVPEVVVTKTVDVPEAAAGTDVTYTLSTVNTGDVAADAVLTDPLPASLDNVTVMAPDGVSCELVVDAVADGLLTCHLDALPADGVPVDILVTATIDPAAPAGPLANTATVDDGTGLTSQSTATVTVLRDALLSVVKTPRVTESTPGSAVVWDVAITNVGPSTAEGAILHEQPYEGYTITGLSGADCDVAAKTCALPTVAVGETVTIEVNGTIAADYTAATVENEVLLENPQGPNAEAEAEIAVVPGPPVTVDPTPVPSASATAAGALATTGSDTRPILFGAAGVLLVGLVLVAVRRRRKA